MQHMLTPHATPIEPFAWWEGAFNEEELKVLRNNARQADQRAVVGSNEGAVIEPNVRRSHVSWVHKNTETAWIFERLGEVASLLNAQYFGFDLTGFGEPLQLTNYDQSEHGMYGWHQDYNAKISRKLSLVVQLTDPSEYEGGNLQIQTSGNPVTVRKQIGLIVAFPAYTLHQVTPVTQGARQSLVAWVSGPKFK